MRVVDGPAGPELEALRVVSVTEIDPPAAAATGAESAEMIRSGAAIRIVADRVLLASFASATVPSASPRATTK
jgi:hypothetical protein